ncbi:hypothetical protein [Mycolicibacter sinensis]|uniref:hypothetical protein n=1 Tax=Mycolicibacter sinensis (strain JDM601) TaxID=875328 RepID=UPI000B22DED3|nr:hypothetical protein [Mycolicibacter sinensis]
MIIEPWRGSHGPTLNFWLPRSFDFCTAADPVGSLRRRVSVVRRSPHAALPSEL